MAEIIKFDPDTPTVSEVLKRSSICNKVLVLGFDSEDQLFFGESGLSKHEIIYLMEKCKHMLFKMED